VSHILMLKCVLYVWVLFGKSSPSSAERWLGLLLILLMQINTKGKQNQFSYNCSIFRWNSSKWGSQVGFVYRV